VPRFGPDFGPDHLPQETGLEARAVSYEKGCYLGQEIVARIHYRGGVNKALRGLDLGAAPPPAAGAGVLHDGRPAGRLGTAVASPVLGRTVALAILHQRAGEAGTVVEVVGGGPATVRDLPFV
jgi:folate-binding protein YgfZ